MTAASTPPAKAGMAVGYLAGASAGDRPGVLAGALAHWPDCRRRRSSCFGPIPPIALVPIVIAWFGLS